MTSDKTPQDNGSADDKKSIENVKIEFPTTFQLKAVLDTTDTDEENMKKLADILESLKIKHSYTNSKTSSKGTYTSYHYQVTLTSKPQMETLYDQLKNVSGLKFAL